MGDGGCLTGDTGIAGTCQQWAPDTDWSDLELKYVLSDLICRVNELLVGRISVEMLQRCIDY